MMLKKICSLFALSCFLVSPGSFAADIHPTLAIVNVFNAQPINKKVESANEISLHITENNSQGHSRVFAVDKVPMDWQAKHIHQLDDLQIWAGALSEGHSSTLNIIINETNTATPQLEQPVGILNITIQNMHGQLIAKWNVPHSKKELPLLAEHGHTVVRYQTHSKQNQVIDFTLESEQQIKAQNKRK